MSQREVVIHATEELLAATTAARLVTKLVDIQSTGRIPGVALTGGGVGTSVLAHLNSSPARDAIDWTRVDIFWGDERFVPADDDDRNEKQARDALLDHVKIDPARVHPMAPSDGAFGDDVDAAASAYAEILDRREALDLIMLGMGPEGHVASVFPGVPGGLRHASGGRRPQLPEAAADPGVADPADDPRGHRGVDHHRRLRPRPARWRWRSAAPARSRSRPRARPAGPVPCGCSIATRPPRCPRGYRAHQSPDAWPTRPRRGGRDRGDDAVRAESRS